MTPRRAIVTGAFSNTGGSVAHALLGRGWKVTTLTNRAATPHDDPRIIRLPLTFDRVTLREVLRHADAFINTYWIRFPYNGVTFDAAVENTKGLVAAANEAGVRRFVHVSVSNASVDSPLEYYSGKARVEQALRDSGLSYGIVRPTLVVGPNDVLTNNIAWFLRRFPIIGVPSGAGYVLQPVTLADVGRITADAVEEDGDVEVDAAGPDQLTFRQYLGLLCTVLNRPRRFVTLPPSVMIAALCLCRLFVHDTILTRDELAGLERNMLVSHEPALGTESVIDWIRAYGSSFGATYINDTLYRFRNAQ